MRFVFLFYKLYVCETKHEKRIKMEVVLENEFCIITKLYGEFVREDKITGTKSPVDYYYDDNEELVTNEDSLIQFVKTDIIHTNPYDLTMDLLTQQKTDKAEHLKLIVSYFYPKSDNEVFEAWFDYYNPSEF